MGHWIKRIHIVLIYSIAIVALFRHDLILDFERFVCKSPAGFDYYNGMVEAQKVQNPANCVVFIGDSITKGLDVSAVANGQALNFGIGGDNTIGLLWRLTQYNTLKLSKAIVLSIGVNDLRVLNEEEIISNYKKILELLPPDVPVIVSCILPVIEHNPSMISVHYKIENARIKNINKRLSEICKSYSHITSIDSFNLMCDETDNLRKEYTTDGVHLSQKGYKEWSEFLKVNLSQVLKN